MTPKKRPATRLDASSPLPLYHQLKEAILQQIVDGTFLPGDQIPTEHEICDVYGVSRTTARQALSILTDDGVILRARRRGSTVALDWRPTPRTRQLRMVMSDAVRARQIEAHVEGRFEVTIDVVPYDEIHLHLLRAVASGDAPDLAFIDHVWVAEFASSFVVHPLDELAPTWIGALMDDVHESIARGYRYEGAVYAIPEELNLAGIWYDMTALAQVQSGIPRTWSELVSCAALLKASGRFEYPIVLPGGESASETTTYGVAVVLASNDASIITDTVRLGTPQAIAALRLIRQFVDDGLVNPAVVTNDWMAGPRALTDGTAPIVIGGSYESEFIADAAGPGAVGRRFRFEPFPAGPDGRDATVIGGMGYVVFRQSPDPVRAMDLLETLMAPEAIESRSSGRWTIPPLRSLVTRSDDESPFVARTTSLLRGARTRPIVAGYQPITREIQRMVETIISGSMRPAAAAERTAEFIGAMANLPVDHS